jgi:hypothetical protein
MDVARTALELGGSSRSHDGALTATYSGVEWVSEFLHAVYKRVSAR